LAGLTPSKDYEVHLVDENVDIVDTNTPADIVAITSTTASAPRAKKIADAFRMKGVPVVMGGIHATVLPDEVAEYADAVVIGEAEPVWEEVLADAARGSLKPRYQQTELSDLIGLPIPRRGLLSSGRYLCPNTVQTARGCPHACTFCSVSTVAGRGYRFRPIPDVIEEMRGLHGWVGLIDDNIAGKPSRAKELFEAMIPLKLRWVGQADLNMAKDPELMKLAVRSGCHALFMGIESVSQKNLEATHKGPNIGLNMSEAIRKIHRAGIGIIGSFVLGLDEDDPSVFAKTLRFAIDNKLVAAQFSVLTPFPGTEMHRQLEAEGRILSKDWTKYTMSSVVYQPKHMSPKELAEGRERVLREFYSISSIMARNMTCRRLLPRLALNWGYRHRNGTAQAR
jgi:radical SAM superfamily enzyme YgiQ (UPF0313 family)